MYYSDMKILRWEEVRKKGEAVNVAYAAQSEGGSWMQHGHDFYEVFRVDSGQGSHIMGEASRSQRLRTGQVGWIRPGDVHGFKAEAGSEPFALINVAFSGQDWHSLQQRYPEIEQSLFSQVKAESQVMEFDLDTSRTLGSLFRDMLMKPRTALHRDSFLLSLIQETGMDETSSQLEPFPPWLRQGVMRFLREESFPSQGVAHLAELAGCSPGHLTRTMQLALGQSPSQWLQTLRLDRACRLLEGSSYSVSEIAALSGFENLSHFHRCFRARTGTTPRRYRLSHPHRVFGE